MIDTLRHIYTFGLQHSDTLLIKVVNTVSAKETASNTFEYKFMISSGIAIVLFFFTLWDKIKWPIISGKILSMTHSPEGTFSGVDLNGEEIKFDGIRYFFKISLNVTRKNVYYKNLKIFVKYPEDKKKYEGRIYRTTKDEWEFNNGKTKILQIPSEQFLSFNNVLEKEKVLFFYTTFFIDKPDYKTFEEIEIVFIDSKGRQRKMQKITSNEICSELLIYEKEIWTDIEITTANTNNHCTTLSKF